MNPPETKKTPTPHASICILNSMPVGRHGTTTDVMYTSKNKSDFSSKTIPQYLVGGSARGNKGKARNWRKSDNVAYVTWRVTRGPGVVKRNERPTTRASSITKNYLCYPNSRVVEPSSRKQQLS